MANLIGRTVPRIGSLARRRAKQPAAADWLHNTCGRFYFQIAYCLFPVPHLRNARYSFFFLLHGLSTISALLAIDNAVIEFRSQRRYFAWSVAMQWGNFNRDIVQGSRYFSGWRIIGDASWRSSRRWTERTIRKIPRRRNSPRSHRPPMIPIMFTTNLKIRS